jgi:hypothetical protein
MKLHYTAEQFFHPRFRAELGVLLALLRVASAYALTQSALRVQAEMPAALARLKVQVVPFLEVFATMWSFSWWQVVLVVAGCAFGLGLFTRTAASALIIFFVGAAMIDAVLLEVYMGAWALVGVIVLAIALFSYWGRVFGLDELIRRFGVFQKKGKRNAFWV